MAGYRRDRINDGVRKVLSEAALEIKDPRVAGTMISFTAADVSGDLKIAKVYFSTLSGDHKEVAAGLTSAKGFFRRKIATELNLRITPDLIFVADSSIEHGAHISKLLHDIDVKPEGGE